MPAEIRHISVHSHCKQYWVEGSPEDVIKEVGSRLEQDRVTPMYEHMALKIISIDIKEFPSKLGICLYKNLYAGD